MKSDAKDFENTLFFREVLQYETFRICKSRVGKSISECTNEELYYALLTLTKKMASGKQHGILRKNYIIYPQNS